MKNLKWALFAVLIGLGTACITYPPKPSLDALSAIDMGPAPTEEVAKKIVMDHFNSTLSDPLSMQFEFGTVKRSYYYYKPAFSLASELVYGWGIKVRVNAKNKYVEWTSYEVFIKNDKFMICINSDWP